MVLQNRILKAKKKLKWEVITLYSSLFCFRDIIADMKVGKRQNGRTSARPTSQIRFDDDGRGYTQERGITSELDAVRRR